MTELEQQLRDVRHENQQLRIEGQKLKFALSLAATLLSETSIKEEALCYSVYPIYLEAMERLVESVSPLSSERPKP